MDLVRYVRGDYDKQDPGYGPHVDVVATFVLKMLPRNISQGILVVRIRRESVESSLKVEEMSEKKGVTRRHGLVSWSATETPRNTKYGWEGNIPNLSSVSAISNYEPRIAW